MGFDRRFFFQVSIKLNQKNVYVTMEIGSQRILIRTFRNESTNFKRDINQQKLKEINHFLIWPIIRTSNLQTKNQ